MKYLLIKLGICKYIFFKERDFGIESDSRETECKDEFSELVLKFP